MASLRWRAAAASWLVLSIACAGCASLAPSSESRVPGAHPAGARSIEGRLSVRYKDLARDKEDALSGRFEWMQRGDDVELTLLDPLGQTVALIRSDPNRSSITFRDGRKVEGATPEALTQDTLGWTVPLRGLGSWLDGHPASGSAAVDLGDGRLRQDNWTIRFVPNDSAPSAPSGTGPEKANAEARRETRVESGAESRTRSGAPSSAHAAAPSSLPRRIDLFYPGPPVEIEMRLVIDQRSGA